MNRVLPPRNYHSENILLIHNKENKILEGIFNGLFFGLVDRENEFPDYLSLALQVFTYVDRRQPVTDRYIPK